MTTYHPIFRSAFFLLLVLISSIASAGASEPADKVREGISSYNAGDYKQAAEIFSDAESAQPDDLRIAFDRGTALAAQGDDKAVELLQKAALSPDLQLAVRARYNLGCLAAEKAKKRFGEHPEKASPEDRKSGMADLAVAIGHFRDCLRMDKDYADARHNLELLRVWIKYMQSLWEQTDRQKQREELDLPGYLQLLEEKQRDLRLAARALSDTGDSPRVREALRVAEEAERKLGEEIRPLKEKIETTLNKLVSPSPAAGAGASPAPAVSNEEAKRAIEGLQSMADEAGMAIETAAGKLHTGKASEAVKPQTDVAEKFNQMYCSVVPFPALLSRAIATQQALIDASSQSVESSNDAAVKRNSTAEKTAGKRAEETEPKKGEANKPSSPPPVASSVPNVSGTLRVPMGSGTRSVPGTSPKPSSSVPLGEEASKEAAWNQEFVTHYVEDLAPLAKQTLKSFESMPIAPAPSSSPPSNPPAAGSPPNAEELQKQRDALKKSLEKAIELGPKVEKLSGEAVQLLRDRKSAEALPKQQEALKLLKDIAEPLPKQNPKQDQNQHNQDKPNQDKQDKHDKNQQEKPDDKQQPKQDPKQQKQNDEREAAQQQAEAQIRQVQERQQKRQEAEKQLQRYLLRSGKVDKDW